MHSKRTTFSALAAGFIVGVSAWGTGVAAAQPAPPIGGDGEACLVNGDGTQQCVGNRAQAEQLAAARGWSIIAIGTNKPNYKGKITVFPVRKGGCSPRTDDIDYSIPLRGSNGYKALSSMDKIEKYHCNYQLVDKDGKKSTWIDHDVARLGTIGKGWNNRAVRVRFT
ncbi:hypothetical protein AAFP35_23820 [Gordonia sp. CPCC 206044]|uniref:hypothetical protein n=1 Tax=Gordonia sp. CPCC 206044 TaxID=3140793 RepID=UPI003AF3CBEE